MSVIEEASETMLPQRPGISRFDCLRGRVQLDVDVPFNPPDLIVLTENIHLGCGSRLHHWAKFIHFKGKMLLRMFSEFASGRCSSRESSCSYHF